MMEAVYHYAQKENSNIQIKIAKLAKMIVMNVKMTNNAKNVEETKSIIMMNA